MKCVLSVIALLPVMLVFSFRISDNADGHTGSQYIYSWESKTTAFSDIQKLYKMDTSAVKASFFKSKSLQLINLDIRCNIKKTIVKTDTAGQQVCFQVIDPIVVLRQNGQSINSKLLQQELTQPVLAEISPQGLIKTVRIDMGISQVAGGLVKEMLSHMQFANSANKTAYWLAEEENTAGAYWAKYQLLDSNKNGYTCSRINNGYIRLRSAIQDQNIKDNGRSVISIDTSGVVTGLNIWEARTVLLSHDTISLSKGKAMARLISVGNVPDREMTMIMELNSSARYQERTALSARLSEEKINRLTYTGTLDDDNYTTLNSALQQTRNDDAEAIDMLTLKFRALAYLFPYHCKDMGHLLQSASFGSSVFKVLSEALTHSQTTAAVDALADVVAARTNEEEVLIELLPVLATTTAPTEKAEAIVKELSISASGTDIRSTAQLALGGMAFNFRKTDAKKSAAITRFLLEMMRGETDTLQKIMVLANTGHATVLPVLSDYLFSLPVSAEVKEAAILGLRLMEEKEAEQLLNRILLSNDSAAVKTAGEVIAFRKEHLQDH
jgi:uncharacterized protein YuzE